MSELFDRPAAEAVLLALNRIRGNVAEVVHDERTRRRMTLETLGRRAGVSKSVVHDVEAGRSVSFEGTVRILMALDLRPELTAVSGRGQAIAPRSRDAVHAAMGEAQTAQFASRGRRVALDEPYQHYQFAGRADLLAWDLEDRALLHLENRTRYPDLQEAAGSYNAKRAYLADVFGRRLGLRHRWRSITHGLVTLWSSEALHSVRLREASFRALCPDPVDAFAVWWSGERPRSGVFSTFVLFDPMPGRRITRRRFVGLDQIRSVEPRYRGYAEAVERLGRR